MADKFKPVRGMSDVAPDSTIFWQHIETRCQQLVERYSYKEIRFPIVEATALFKRSVGQATDIVEKEMYSFDDRNGDSLSLRPEGTASCVRAAINLGLLHNQIQRLWYQGPMFRHERPQKGRYRQFHQFSVEAFGMGSPAIEVEHILMMQRFFKELGLLDHLRLEINTLGNATSRSAYREALVAYFSAHEARLDEDSKRRLKTNPLRIVDSKNPDMQDLIAKAPKMTDHLDQESSAHFTTLLTLLDSLEVNYQVNPQIVRGLDYYCHTVYEWTSTALGSQGTVCAGGRYDGLVEQLGAKSTPAVGFSLGLERCVLLLEQLQSFQYEPDVYMIAQGEVAIAQAMALAERLRNDLPRLRLEMNADSASMKSQFKRANKSQAHYAVIIADEELEQGLFGLKNLRESEPQQSMTFAALSQILQEKLC